MKMINVAKDVLKKNNIIVEGWNDEATQALTRDQKAKFMEQVANYNSFGKAIYNEHDLVNIAKNLSEIAKVAEAYALNEAGDDFDKLTVKRNMTELKKLSEEFGKVATEVQASKNRMTGLYEDMGHILNRYYEIKDVESQNVVKDEPVK